MVLKNGFAALICIMLAASTSVAIADEYRPDEFLSLDLSRAALSPKRFGPDARFAPLPVEAKTDRADPARADRVTHSRTRVARADKPHGAARTKLARRHGNPLDAQAFDARIQVWPCKSGGICGWK
jgi:hypothetical protein